MTIQGFKDEIRKIGYRSRATSDNLNASFQSVEDNFKALKDYILALESKINIDFDAELGPSYVIPEKIYPTNTLNGFSKRNGTTEGFGYYRDSEGVAGKTYFYSSIIGRKPIINPALGCFMGMRTFNCDSLQLMEDEHGPNGEKVYAVDGRDWMRAVGDVAAYNNSAGNRIECATVDYYIEVVNFFEDCIPYVSTSPSMNTTIEYETESGEVYKRSHATNVNSPFYDRYIDTGSPIDVLKFDRNIQTLKISGHYMLFFKLELGVNSNEIIIPKQKAVMKGINKIEIPYTELDYHPGASAWDLGTDFGNGGKVSVFVHPETLQIRVGTNWIPKYAKSCGYTDIKADHSFQPSFRHEPITLTSDLTEEDGLTDYDTIACHTSNVSETGTVSASIEDGTNHSWHAFNKDTKTKTKTYTFLQSNNPYLTYEYFVTQKHLSGYSITSGDFGTDRMPTAWLVELYNIETQKWEQVDSQTSQLFGSAYTTKKYALSSTKEFSKIRIQFTQNGGATTTDVQEVQFFTSVKRVRPMFDLVEKHYGYTGTSGVVNASSKAHPAWAGWGAFNKQTGVDNGWISSPAASLPAELIYKFNIQQKIQSLAFNTYYASTVYGIIDFELLGSNDDGSSWNSVLVVAGEMWTHENERKLWKVSTPAYYRWYKIRVTASNNGQACISNLSFLSHEKRIEPFFENEELVKTFHVREFGNGGKNTGVTTSTTPEDISVAGGANFSSGFTLDDGCTNLTAVSNYGNHAGSDVIYPRTGGSITFTGYFSGVSLKNWYRNKAYVNGDLSSNLPLGTHTVEIQRISNKEAKIYIDGILILQTNELHFHVLSSLSLYQPKTTELPEGALLLGEYMLNATSAPCTVAGYNTIGKGVRREFCDRNIFYDDSGSGGSESWKVSPNGNELRGHRYCYSDRSYKEFRYPFRGTGISIQYMSARNRVKLALFELSKDGGKTFFPVSDDNLSRLFNGATRYSPDSNFTAEGKFSCYSSSTEIGKALGITGLALGNYVLKVSDSVAGEVLQIESIEIQTPIHRANHYQEWETPYLYELVGGGDGIDNQNLVVTSRSETLDELNRPDIPYRGEVCWHVGRNLGQILQNSDIINNFVRGSEEGFNATCKNIICLPNGHLILKKSGYYNMKGDYKTDGTKSYSGQFFCQLFVDDKRVSEFVGDSNGSRFYSIMPTVTSLFIENKAKLRVLFGNNSSSVPLKGDQVVHAHFSGHLINHKDRS